MLKKILKLNGVTELSSSQSKTVSGGRINCDLDPSVCSVNSPCCLEPSGHYYCKDKLSPFGCGM